MLLTFLLACARDSLPPPGTEAIDTSECQCIDDDGDGTRPGCTPTYPEYCTDCDCDGYTKDTDCDDFDYYVHPNAGEGAPSSWGGCREDVPDGKDNSCNGTVDEGTSPLTEVCDGEDNDCDSEIDEEGDTPFYADADGDGFGDPRVSVKACDAPAGYVATPGDCNDADMAINPEGVDLCGDSIDQDCDGADSICPVRPDPDG